MFKPINITSELKQNRSIEQNLIDEAHLLLKESALHGSRFNTFAPTVSDLIIDVNLLEQKDKDAIFSLREIKKFCVNYHMRFIAKKKYQVEIDKEAILKIYAFEEQYNVRIKDFFVIVSEDVNGLASETPSVLVFGKLAANSFYYFGSFGKELSKKRKVLFFPLRSIYAFTLYNFIPSVTISFLFPTAWLQTIAEVELSLRIWFSFHIYIALFGFSMFIGGLSNMRFSDTEWDNPFKK
ncbi:MAG: hypothetical protein V4667_12525 [Bacteroidota bacterium]